MSRNQNLILTLLSRNRNAKPRVCDAVPLGSDTPRKFHFHLFARAGRQRGSPPRPRSAPGRGGLDGGRLAPAWAADVVSSNIVGYQKITLAEGFNAVGLQFVNVGGGLKDLTDSFIMDSSYKGYNADYDFFTRMQVWNGNGYDFYGWAGTSGTDVDDDPDLDNTWTDMAAEAVDGVDFKPFSGVWIRAEKAGTVLVSGEVVTTNITVALEEGFNLICNPFPAAIPVSTFGVLDSSFKGYNADYDFFSRMQVWNGNGYDFYGWAGTSGTDVDDDPDLDNTWTDMAAEATDAVIPAGGAVWIRAEKAGTISFTSPLSE